ncbi:MAG TPA: HNH endonuclease [Chitinophagaceae bacterium]|jgi:putative restriction endonuclease|nr:HNH endonuclease [Chitinophagaceae bacterium]
MEAIHTYIKKFSRLHVASVKGSKAPHKAVLLLAVMDAIADEEIAENKIFITPELVARFKDRWAQLVHDIRFSANFSLPFYHLKSEGFWKLHTLPGREILLTSSHSIKSFGHLKQVIDFVSLDEDLFHLFIQPQSRIALQQTLLSAYFPDTEIREAYHSGLIHQLTNEILHESPAAYKQKAERADEEEVFIRGGVFKKVIPRVYHYTCAISGMRLIAGYDVQMIDACHIVPFARSGDDTITNGLSLCPNLHRAFDRGLITIDEEYRVRTTASFTESESGYGIRSFEGRKILLPEDNSYYPSQANLEWHRTNIYRNRA